MGLQSGKDRNEDKRVFPLIDSGWPDNSNAKELMPEGFDFTGEFRIPTYNNWFLNRQGKAEQSTEQNPTIGCRHILHKVCFNCNNEATVFDLQLGNQENISSCETCQSAIVNREWSILLELQN